MSPESKAIVDYKRNPSKDNKATLKALLPNTLPDPPAGTPPAGTPPAGKTPAGKTPAGTPPAGTPQNNENKSNPLDVVLPPTDKEVKENMELLKLEGFLNKLSKKVESGLFKEEAKFLDGRFNTDILMTAFVIEYSKKTGGKYPKNIIVVVPNTELKAGWCQLATTKSTMYCDSSEYDLRFLYFGKESLAFVDTYKTYGMISAVISKAPKDKPKVKTDSA